MLDGPVAVTPLTCAECGRPWFDPSERWRLLRADDDNDQLDPGETAY